jgi:hypothetical protein
MNKKGYEGFEATTAYAHHCGSTRSCVVVGAGSKRFTLRWTNRHPHGNGGEPLVHTFTRRGEEVTLSGSDMDRLVKARTGFCSLRDMATAKGGYRPTISPRDAYDRAMIAAYNRLQTQRNDPRRAYTPGF